MAGESQRSSREYARQHFRLWLMMVLTVVTGMVDAVGFLGLDRVFTGNMTGNVVILGMGLAGQDGLPVAGPLVALAAYIVGAAAAGRVLRHQKAVWNSTITILLGINALVFLAVGTTLLATGAPEASVAASVVAASIAVLMGAQASVARFLAVHDMTTVVITSTITAFASENLFVPGRGRVMNRRFWAIAAILVGALIGALMMEINFSVPFYVAGVATALTTALGHRYWKRTEK